MVEKSLFLFSVINLVLLVVNLILIGIANYLFSTSKNVAADIMKLGQRIIEHYKALRERENITQNSKK